MFIHYIWDYLQHLHYFKSSIVPLPTKFSGIDGEARKKKQMSAINDEHANEQMSDW